DLTQGDRLAVAEPAIAQRRKMRLPDRRRARKCADTPPLMLEVLAESLYETVHDRDAGIDAQLLKRDHIAECLEQLGESRRTHTAQRLRNGSKLTLAQHTRMDCVQVQIEPQYPAKATGDLRARRCRALRAYDET